ncbi:MAG TPA: ribose-phosphate pyrophosphokinase [Methylophaga sp.]|nr:ribose-phosphate pyrophosphokinase [Methylophaga sp.]
MNGPFTAKIFTGTANPKLAKDVTDYLHITLGAQDLKKFSDGEIRVEIEETVRGDDVYLIQPTCSPTNDNLMELLIMADTARRSACDSITAIIPYYGYARQDRRPDYTRTPITSRLVADMIETAGIDKVVTIDLHSGQQQGFFHIPVTNISASPEIVGDIWRNHKMDEIIVVSPDTGGVARARHIAKQLNDADLAIVDKRRPKANVAQVMNVIGQVEGKTCILIDDMIDTAGTLAKGAAALKERGATKVVAYATHGVFSGEALDNMVNSDIDEIVVTDTIPLSQVFKDEPKIRTISIAPLLAETIRRMQSKQSISELYA